MTPDVPPIIRTLAKAVDGLTYPSESDEPFVPFCWPAAEPKPAGGAKAGPAQASVVPATKSNAPAADPGAAARAQVVARSAAGRPVAAVPIDRFFADLDGSDDADRYHQLRRTLESELTGLNVFRVGDGEVRVDVYLIGRARTGEWAGLQTASVET